MQPHTKQQNRLTRLIFLSLLGGSSFLVQYFEFPIPGLPAFLKIDFSEIPALIGAFIYGPVSGIIIEFLKNFLHFLFHGSETGAIPVGQLSNFLAGSVFVTLTYILSKKVQGLKGLLLGLSIATLITTILMSLANYFILFPLYSILINMTLASPEKQAIVLYGIAPFNIIKGILIALIFIPLYRKISPYLSRQFSFR
ncbi:ECF transporter S component [Thermoflavimicrobium daqui]|jgi:riboflavin transporter FmnP|uniref:Riboflavin transporter n=1 Tax=Thermoflavimicrobium daqui TaxID=2137476 RepID=A0A364K3D4_9BACL|nr:ECF transporter S component [Thermoflavimicrobium daqui]RAL23347.1 riboflavin transporter FmnP [Thermoflavimicrobium daqui]